MFYTYCPLLNKTMCGTNTTNMSLPVNKTMSTFRITDLRFYETDDFEAFGYDNLTALKAEMPDRYDACYYLIETPYEFYKNLSFDAKLKVSIKEQKNVDVMMFSGMHFNNLT